MQSFQGKLLANMCKFISFLKLQWRTFAYIMVVGIIEFRDFATGIFWAVIFNQRHCLHSLRRWIQGKVCVIWFLYVMHSKNYLRKTFWDKIFYYISVVKHRCVRVELFSLHVNMNRHKHDVRPKKFTVFDIGEKIINGKMWVCNGHILFWNFCGIRSCDVVCQSCLLHEKSNSYKSVAWLWREIPLRAWCNSITKQMNTFIMQT